MRDRGTGDGGLGTAPETAGAPQHRRCGRLPHRIACALAVLAIAALAGCASSRRPTSSPTEAPAAALTAGWSEEGLASWYGEPYHGRATASGRRYDMHEMTAAHRSLPFGTEVRVCNLRTQAEATVVVDDRGPFVEGRIIDLSRAAAEQLGVVRDGVVPVRIEVTRMGDGMIDAPCWDVQVGAFAREENVARARATLERAGFALRTAPAGGGLTRVRVAGLAGRAAASDVSLQLADAFPGATPVPCPETAAGVR